MSFEEEFKQLLNIESETTDIYIVFMVGKGAIVQGYKKLLEIGDNKLVVIGKNKRKIELCGQGLQIISLVPSEIVVHGRISSIGEINE